MNNVVLTGRLVRDPELTYLQNEKHTAKTRFTLAVNVSPETKAYRNYVFDSREVLDIKFIKVKGHSGNEYNNRADYLAGKALEA